MNRAEEVKERFTKAVAEHEMRIVRDDGLYRNIRFQKPGTWFYGFDIITWPGHLCVAGDIGYYVFARLPDMFEFFRQDKDSRIDFRYWAQKVKASDTASGIEEYSEEKFRENVLDYLESRAASPKVRRQVERDILECGYDKDEAAYAIANFLPESPTSFSFDDFWEYDSEDYTYQFLFCCYAIAWAIQQYDAAKSQEAA